MYLYDFNALKENEKAEYVWQHCNFIGAVEVERSRYSLYSSRGKQNFYVEFELKENKIVEIRSFISGWCLDKYLDKIDIIKMIIN